MCPKPFVRQLHCSDAKLHATQFLYVATENTLCKMQIHHIVYLPPKTGQIALKKGTKANVKC